MSKIFRIAEPMRRRGAAPYGACVAVVVALVLTGCQSAPPPDVRAPGQTAETLLKVADDTRAGGDPGTAVTLYRRIHEMEPSNAEVLTKLGSTLMQLNAYTEAVKAYRLAVAAAPKDPEVHRGLALALLSLNQPEPALVELQKALALKPDDPRIFSTLGVAHDLVGRHDLAQQDYQNGLRIAPQNAALRNNYALSLALSGDYGAAAMTLSDIANDPTAPPRYVLNLALIYGLAGDDKRSAAIARTALDEAAVRNNLAYYAMLRAMDDKARAAAIIGGQLHNAPPSNYAAIKPADDSKPSTADASTPTTADAAPADAAPVDKETLASPAAPSGGAAPSEAAAQDNAAATPDKMVETSASAPSTESTPAPASPGDAASDAASGTPTKLAATDSSSSPAAPAAPADTASPAPGLMPYMPATPAQPSSDTGAGAKSASTPPAATTGSGGYAVQLGSFSNEANAHRLADQLNAKGYNVTVSHYRDHNGRDWYPVRAGSYASADEATAAANRIRDAEHVPAVVVRMHASAA